MLKHDLDLGIVYMVQLHVMGNSYLMFVSLTHKCVTNDPDTKPRLGQNLDLDFGSSWLSFVHMTYLQVK